MEKKMENVCLRIIRLSCIRVAEHLAGINGLSDASVIHIRVKDRSALLQTVAGVVSTGRVSEYRNIVGQALSVKSTVRLKHSVDWAALFLQEVDACRDARVCQKRLVDLMAAEKYLSAAYSHDLANRSSRAMVEARKVVAGIHSERFLEGFTMFGRPKVDASVRASLEKRAFDSRYSYTGKDAVKELAERRWQAVYACRGDFFLPGEKGMAVQKPVQPRRQASKMPVLPVPEKRPEPVMDMALLEQLYGEGYAEMPTRGKRRRFVNLAARSLDVRNMPRRMLATKRRHLAIESLTKHGYIMDFYATRIKGQMVSDSMTMQYLQEEAKMHQRIRCTEEDLGLGNRVLYLPGGVVVQAPGHEAMHDFLHRVNTIYAALFGFTNEDSLGGGMWLEDSVRSAYTDEGVADYRLGVVKARMNG